MPTTLHGHFIEFKKIIMEDGATEEAAETYKPIFYAGASAFLALQADAADLSEEEYEAAFSRTCEEIALFFGDETIN